jgi:hypothetical protein
MDDLFIRCYDGTNICDLTLFIVGHMSNLESCWHKMFTCPFAKCQTESTKFLYSKLEPSLTRRLFQTVSKSLVRRLHVYHSSPRVALSKFTFCGTSTAHCISLKSALVGSLWHALNHHNNRPS